MLTTLKSQPKKYIDKLADTYKKLFNEDPPKGYKTPLDKNDHPELDTSEILEGDMATKYLTMVGQLQWLVTLGRFDIHAQVATMSRFRAAPRKGHMDRLKRIYSYAIRTKDYAISDTYLSKTLIAPCYCQMMGPTLKEEIRITQYNNPTKAGKYSLEDLCRASDNIPHHYPKF